MKNSIITFDKNITNIAESYFENNEDLKKIIIPDTISSIGKKAFLACKNLTEITLPKGLKSISNQTFKDCKSLKNVEIPEEVTEIGEQAFSGCSSLEEINIPKSVKIINSKAFENCNDKKLKELTIPSNVKYLGIEAFKGCNELEDILIEDGVNSIQSSCFEDCTSLKSISIPDSIFRISSEMFKGCCRLKDIRLPSNLTLIDNMAFQDCTSLQEIEIPDSVFSIDKSAFSNCINLKHIKLPEKVTKIHGYTFDFCINLKEIEIPENVKEIGDFAFSNCFALKDVTLPKSLIKISDSAFKNTAISEISIPDEVTYLGKHAFRNCKNLKNVTLSKNLTEILSHTFSNCSSLSTIELPEGIKSIKSMAFEDCTSLQEVILPKTIEEIETDAFLDCPSLQKIKIPNTIKKLGSLNSNVPYFFSTSKEGFILTTEELTDSIPVSSLKIALPILSTAWDQKNLLLKEQENENVLNVYNTFVNNELSESQMNKFVNNHNFKFFNQLKIDEPAKYQNLYKLLYNLGGFDKPIIENDKKVDYAQKVIGFIQEKIKKNPATLDNLNLYTLNKMKPNGFNKEFTEFFLSNYDSIMEESLMNPEFLVRCYNEFDAVQKTNTNHHGIQRQLKPTVKKFKEFFDDNKFIGVTPETKQIADTIAPYFSEQKIFDEAVAIDNERISKKIPNNILSVPLKETDVFEQIDQYANNIQLTSENMVSILSNLARKEFTYEWLEKNDPQNFILGKLCSCCSHLEGAGYGIMKASIVDPNVQTLVIKNKNGEIVAKSTLFINPEERYGVFNNVEINEDVSNDDKQKIFQKYMLGINKFVKIYNQEHPNKKLKQVNVGMHYNDLMTEIFVHKYESPDILPSINYGAKYGKENQYYTGDSDSSQYILWENDEPEFN